MQPTLFFMAKKKSNMIIMNRSIISLKYLTIVLALLLINACTQKNTSEVNQNEVIMADSLCFQYSDIIGIGQDTLYNRRDNSDVIKGDTTYYVYYSKMKSPVTAGYWATIWYATSEHEGFTWHEEGMALGLGGKGEFDSHSVFTPNIMVSQGKYYLYYTGVQPTSGNNDNTFENNSINDFTAITLAFSTSS